MWAWCHVIGFEESDPCVNDLCTNCLYHTPRSLNGLWQTYWPWDLDPVNYVIKIYISCDYKISPNAKWVQNKTRCHSNLSKGHPENFFKFVSPNFGLGQGIIIYLYKSNGSGRSGIFGSSFCEARIAARWSKRFIMTSAFVNSIILTSNAKLLKIIIQSSDNSFNKSFRHELSHDNIDEHSSSV